MTKVSARPPKFSANIACRVRGTSLNARHYLARKRDDLRREEAHERSRIATYPQWDATDASRGNVGREKINTLRTGDANRRPQFLRNVDSPSLGE